MLRLRGSVDQEREAEPSSDTSTSEERPSSSGESRAEDRVGRPGASSEATPLLVLSEERLRVFRVEEEEGVEFIRDRETGCITVRSGPKIEESLPSLFR